ncbi:hypothetical protein BGX26_005619 [Mortierella sp. AD094]|nr:hypothetical protein BGX26_005619 [Mortierella sp. AD094]
MSKLRQTQEAPSTTSISQPHSEPPEATSFKSLAVPRRNKSRRPSVVKATDLDSGAGVDQGTKTKAGSETDIDIKAEPNATVEADTETPQARNGTHLASPRLLPKTVVIRGLPKYSPGDDIGRNAKRNEVYARIRLMALREHQQVLVKLLSDLLDIDRMTHQNQTQDRCQDSCHPIESQSAKSGSATKASDHNECRHIQRHQRCDIAMHEYQKAIIDLWQADQNMSYWLIRYIRTTRRIGRSFEFMFEEPLIDGAPAVPTDLKSTQTTADSESTQATADPESTQATTDSESAQATSEESDASATTTDSESTQATTGFKSIQDASKESGAAGSPRGLSNFDLERVGILMPKLLKFSADGRKRDTFITTKLLGADKNTRKAPMRSSSLMAFRHFQPSDNRDSILKIHQKPLPKIPTESQDTNTSANPEVVASETVAAPVEPPQLLLPAAPTRPPPAIPAPSPPGVTRPTTPVSTTLLSILPSPPISPPPPLPTTLYSTAPVSLTASKRLRSCLQPQEARQDENQKQPQANATSGTSSMPGSRIRPRFQDFDDLEALIFVGLHMQSLQKSREFLNQFNKESARSRVAIERFEIAKQEYELRVLAKPSWKSKEQRRDPQQFNRAFVEAF